MEDEHGRTEQFESGYSMPPRELKPSILSFSKDALALIVDIEFWTTIKLTQPPGSLPGPSHFQGMFLVQFQHT